MGSPPLTRGPRQDCDGCDGQSGITPAHAGTTSWCPPVPAQGEDHPRSRGDHKPLKIFLVANPGSPPLTRGPQVDGLDLDLAGRITPAHAGTTQVNSRGPTPTRDHPRSRGDHGVSQTAGDTSTGSPPLTRGPPQNLRRRAYRTGITPAHAGTTDTRQSALLYLRDHPRSRGDHILYVNHDITL